MDPTVVVALIAGAVALVGTGATYLSNRRAGKAATRAQLSSEQASSSASAAEAQRVALEGLRDLIEAQQEELRDMRERMELLVRERDAERSARADAQARLAALEAHYREALGLLDDAQARLAALERAVPAARRGK